ncbi:septation ring formation regulator EzrA [Alkalicoccus urumqiensis]|uniref:Septation ring formation regulator EzrA n=1 Tax=Alkalicoccus urumqiensis TaxID=1548213 RepID=A0A2P6MD89_ALKUR|nr:septation ring formation regulator EzrA [Alkalicoccus urumqiensis]PRO64245.1 hypothetical protein C6I21_15865 [Alkalicoccus urumqiensis]
MSYLIYGFIILVAAVVIYGTWARKNIYRDVDRLGIRKVELMNRPVNEELSKMKGLRLSGETEERFDEWRSEWDQLVTVQLPDIEEKLFDIEEYANKYRFGRARKEADEASADLDRIEEHIDQLIEEVHHLIHSEEQNRHDIERIREFYEETRKKLWVQKGTIGEAAPKIEAGLDEAFEGFAEFEEQTEEGNYFQAGETLMQVREKLEELHYCMDEIPARLLLAAKDLPKQIQELEAGIEEMSRAGYPVEKYEFHMLMQSLRERCANAEQQLYRLEIDEAKEEIYFVEESIAAAYDDLEAEAHAKIAAEQLIDENKHHLRDLPLKMEELKSEWRNVKESYRLTEEDEKELDELDARRRKLATSFAVLQESAENRQQTFVELERLLHEWAGELEAFNTAMEEQKDKFAHLRSDELAAASEVEENRKALRRLKNRLRRSMLPKTSELLAEELQDAEEAVTRAQESLKEVPLDMTTVRRSMEEAGTAVRHVTKKGNQLLDTGEMAERAIQYGNRYRTRHDDVNIMLLQAEDRFRQGWYEESLELAVEGIEKVDRNVLERLEKESAEKNSVNE